MKCPKCQGEMEIGNFVWWGSSNPQPIMWTDNKEKKTLGIVTGLENSFKNTTNRCQKCGFVEIYAK